jgi:NADPH2:quinone reductase
MARVIRFHKTGGPEVLQIDEVDVGAPGRGELRLRVHAFGLNRAEAMFRSGISIWSSRSCRAGSATRPQVPSRRSERA